eukprot:CAMPEP_0118935776 /NCGR_PEP_ID=MMETSP1169-20130426/15826_1 /TAXON_ID=36882 /ORGANISM="Pyramimonas obovata, Strain CCMP722" /LENGTH=81 /DNA_ID=CAMNT_0006878839 /DNA_START=648 /DNA_END=890 /DNA_ORIENTATION=-
MTWWRLRLALRVGLRLGGGAALVGSGSRSVALLSDSHCTFGFPSTGPDTERPGKDLGPPAMPISGIPTGMFSFPGLSLPGV